MDTMKIDETALREAAHLAGHEGVSLRMSSETRGLITRYIFAEEYTPDRLDEFEAEAGPLRMVFGADIVLDEVIRYGWVSIALRGDMETRCIVVDEPSEEPEPRSHKDVEWAGTRSSIAWQTTDYDAPSEDAEPFDLSTLEGRAIADYEIIGETEIRVEFEDGATLVMRAPNAVLADASLDLEPGVRIGEVYERTDERSRWYHKHSLKIVDDGRTHDVFFIARGAPPEVSYELLEPRTDVHTHEGNVPPDTDGVRGYGIIGRASNAKYLAEAFAEQRARRVAKQWAAEMEKHYMEMNWRALGLLMPPSIVDQMTDVLERTDVRQFVREQAEKLDREIMADLDSDTRTPPAPWRDPAEEWPEGGQDVIVAVTREMRGGSTSRHVHRAVVYSNRLIDIDPSAPDSFYAGCKVSRQGTRYLDAWMPLPSHPLDNDDTTRIAMSNDMDPEKEGTITPWSAVVHEDVLQATHDHLATGLTVQELIDAGIWKRMDAYGNLMLVADLDNDDTAS